MSTTTTTNGSADDPAAPKPDWMGLMKGTAEIVGDIVGPTSDLVAWEAMN